MSEKYEGHPQEEDLIASVADGGDERVREHIETCESCMSYIRQISSIKEMIQTFPEEKEPDTLHHDILASIKKKKPAENEWYTFDISIWYRNPLIAVLGILGVVIFLFMFYVFIL